MTDFITRQAQRVVDRITADAVAAATQAYGKVLPFQVEAEIAMALGRLLPGLEAERRQEEADVEAQCARRSFNSYSSTSGTVANLAASAMSALDFSASFGGTSSDE